MDKFGGLFIPVAPTGEQHRIADFLDAKCAEIDVLTTDIQTQIDTLEQYKRSVITETVTKGLNPDAEMNGQRDSMDWQYAFTLGGYSWQVHSTIYAEAGA